MAFSERLKTIRKSKKITQKALGNYLEIKETSYQHYEYGKREPNYEMLIKICNYLDVSADYLLGLSDDPTRH